jgi:Secretion system C-terminal sorting domain
MKTTLRILTYCIVFTLSVNAQSSKDLPSPAANNVTLATGSYVIPMDNTLQANASGFFNLKSYGLIIHLLNNNVKIKWVIKAAKAKDAVDFTVNAEQVLPITGSNTSRNFIAGPFIIQTADTAGVAALAESFYTAHSLTGNNRPAIYRTTASVTVDIRHDLTGFKPKAVILNDGGNDSIHIKYMQAASITTANYSTGLGVDLFTKCYTFASEPHSDDITNETARAIRTFVTYGGNFLAQCEAVTTYENHATHGHLHSTNGITKVNTNIAAASTIYPNPDLPYSQYQGTTDIAAGGSVRNWVLSPLSSFTNNAHNHGTGGTIVTQTPVGASVAKINASNKAGGLVFYIGSHEFASYTNINSINGIRMYMNAFLTPVSLNLSCDIASTMNYILAANTDNFTVVAANNNAELEWETNEQSSVSTYIVEKSADGKEFTPIATITGVTGKKTYQHKDPLYITNAVVYYRIKATDLAERAAYSPIRAVRVTGESKPVQMFPNPAHNEIMLQLPKEWMNQAVIYEIMDQSGRLVQKEAGKVHSNVHNINLSRITPGTYYIRTICNGQTQLQRFLKQ